VSFATLGWLGSFGFGNQLLQYFFLRSVCKRYDGFPRAVVAAIVCCSHVRAAAEVGGWYCTSSEC